MKNKHMTKLMYLMIAGSTLRDNVSPAEAKLLSCYLNNRENKSI